jgi:TolA-binding protein
MRTTKHISVPPPLPPLRECPPDWMMAAAASGENDQALQHTVTCEPCGLRLRQQQSMRVLGHSLQSATILPVSRRRGLAASVLAIAQSQDDVRFSDEKAQKSSERADARSGAAVDALPIMPVIEKANLETMEILKVDPLGDIEVTPIRRIKRKHIVFPLFLAAAAAALWIGYTRVRTDSSTVDSSSGASTLAPVANATAPLANQSQAAGIAPKPLTTVGAVNNSIAQVRPQGQVTYQQLPTTGDVIITDGTLEIDGEGKNRVSVSGSNVSVTGFGARAVARASGGVVQSVSVFAGSVQVTGSGKNIMVSAGQQWTWESQSLEQANVTPTDASAQNVTKVPNQQRAGVGNGTGSTKTSSSESTSTQNKAHSATTIATSSAPTGSQSNPSVVVAADSNASTFRDSFIAMKAGKWRAALSGFQKLVDDPVTGEDASYWAAVANAKLGDAELARRDFARYLQRFPNGARVGEVHVNLGRLFESVDRASARNHYMEAARDGNSNVRAAAAAGLEALRHDASNGASD